MYVSSTKRFIAKQDHHGRKQDYIDHPNNLLVVEKTHATASKRLHAESIGSVRSHADYIRVTP